MANRNGMELEGITSASKVGVLVWFQMIDVVRVEILNLGLEIRMGHVTCLGSERASFWWGSLLFTSYCFLL